jgi:uncharacterized protein (DUF2147 family)
MSPPSCHHRVWTGRKSALIRLLALVFLALSIQSAGAGPPPTGLWLTQDREGVIAVAPCGSNLCARIVGVVLDHPDDKMPVDRQGVTQCNLPLITDARQVQPNLWQGHITDPRSGDHYGVELRLDPRGTLALRGYLGIPLLGRTQIWTRYAGRVPSDCRLYAGLEVKEADR